MKYTVIATHRIKGQDETRTVGEFPSKVAAEEFIAHRETLAYVHEEDEPSRPRYTVVGESSGHVVESDDHAGEKPAKAKPAHKTKAGHNGVTGRS